MADAEKAQETERRVSLARAWLAGYLKTRPRVPRHAYIEAGTDSDREGRLALSQILVDGAAPREILDLLATCIAPDYQPPDGTSFPAREIPLVASDNPLRLIVGDLNPRRLDFSFRTGTRRRGVSKQPDPVRDGAILQEVMKLIVAGKTKTAAFEIVGDKVGLTSEGVRKIWKNHSSFVKFWENEMKDNG